MPGIFDTICRYSGNPSQKNTFRRLRPLAEAPPVSGCGPLRFGFIVVQVARSSFSPFYGVQNTDRSVCTPLKLNTPAKTFRTR